jgi:protein tyrosine phosphatase (PTP) superfamily phosphohydrolase (DUF442 family)
MRARLLAGCTVAAIVLAGCQSQPSASPPVAVQKPGQGRQPPERLAARHLPNAFRIHQRVISGGQPQGEDGFRELAALGVRTVISVDGATPDVATAKRHGLRYVHLPHGYDGIPVERVQQLAKAVRDLPGPIYIHCHHGKHRSPAASAVACVAAGLLDSRVAVGVLETAGTSAAYRGLYASARDARPLDARLLDALRPEFPEKAKIPPLAEAMVALEQTHDRLKSIAAVGWRTPLDHPDLEPAHEALLMREHFTELLRSEDLRQQPQGFLRMLRESESTALELEHALAARKAAGYTGEAPPAIAAAFAKIVANCSACHKAYRDVPLGEKAKP